MTAFDSDHVFPESKYYDLGPLSDYSRWGFDIRLLAEAHGNSHYEEVFKALLTGLNELIGSKIWTGSGWGALNHQCCSGGHFAALI